MSFFFFTLMVQRKVYATTGAIILPLDMPTATMKALSIECVSGKAVQMWLGPLHSKTQTEILPILISV